MFRIPALFSSYRRHPVAGHRSLNPGIALGVAVSAIFIFGSMVFSGSGTSFISFAGLAIVFGGLVGAICMQHPRTDLTLAWEGFLQTLYQQPGAEDSPPTVSDRVSYLTRLSRQVKENGLIVLDTEAQHTRDPYLRLALELCVDHYAPKEIRQILENESRSSYERDLRKVAVFESLGGYAPAMGLIGTLIGLVQMLHGLGEMTQVGPAMSVALLTTLYGALLANLVFFPVAGKLRLQAEQAVHVKSVTLAGLLSLAQEENSIVLEQRLQSFTSLQEVG